MPALSTRKRKNSLLDYGGNFPNPVSNPVEVILNFLSDNREDLNAKQFEVWARLDVLSRQALIDSAELPLQVSHDGKGAISCGEFVKKTLSELGFSEQDGWTCLSSQ